MVLDLVFMGSSADRSGGDVALPIAAGETTVTGNGVPGTGNQWYPNSNGAIVAAFCNSETAAAVDIRFNKTTDANYNHLFSTHLQTDPVRSQILNMLNYPIKTGDAIQAQGTNAGAVLDVLGLYVDKGKGGTISAIPPGKPAPGAMIVEATSTFTHVADTVAEGTIVFVDWTPRRDVTYQIIGMAANSASGCGTRLRFLEGPNINDFPGVPTADTSTGLEYMMFYGDFGEFKGQTPPRCQTIAVAADAVTNLKLLIVPKTQSN